MLRAVVRHIVRNVRELLKAPFRLAQSIFGSPGTPPPPPERCEEVVDEQVEELRDELAEGRSPEPMRQIVRTLGERIHAYADGDRSVQDAFDFSKLPDPVGLALLNLAPAQLWRLAAAGPGVCGRWALGEKTGLVGVPPCKEAARPTKRKALQLSEDRGDTAFVPDRERPSAAQGLAFA